jgi:hypothetical protein
MSNFNHWTSDQIERQKSFYEGIRGSAPVFGSPKRPCGFWQSLRIGMASRPAAFWRS